MNNKYKRITRDDFVLNTVNISIYEYSSVKLRAYIQNCLEM